MILSIAPRLDRSPDRLNVRLRADSAAAMSAPISRVPIISSSLASVGYSPDERVLEAEFRAGDIYRFFLAPAIIWDELLAAPSKGAFFNQRIKDQFPVATASMDERIDLTAALVKSIEALRNHDDAKETNPICSALELIEFNHRGSTRLSLIVRRLVLGWRYVSDRLKNPPIVEPIDPFERCEFYGLERSPGTAQPNNFGLEQSDDGFGQRIIVESPTLPTEGVMNRQILNAAIA